MTIPVSPQAPNNSVESHFFSSNRFSVSTRFSTHAFYLENVLNVQAEIHACAQQIGALDQDFVSFKSGLSDVQVFHHFYLHNFF
jgi:hypothetical protein